MSTIRYNSKLLAFFPDWVDAFVFQDTIFVRGDYISPRLLRHEQKHVEQYARYGTIGFLVRYAWYSLRYGYQRNPLEVEARAAE